VTLDPNLLAEMPMAEPKRRVILEAWLEHRPWGFVPAKHETLVKFQAEMAFEDAQKFVDFIQYGMWPRSVEPLINIHEVGHAPS
jgi:hypothetical protein